MPEQQEAKTFQYFRFKTFELTEMNGFIEVLRLLVTASWRAAEKQ